jgi:hypothetical protein
MVKLATGLATGEFVWMLGDDDLVAPGAVARVLALLEEQPHLDAIYLNFNCTTITEWPATAAGGFTPQSHHPANPATTARLVPEWRELIDPQSSLCTQVYTHVLRRTIWQNYWRGREPGELYSEARATYPHAFMIAEAIMHKPCYYEGEPVLTIFDGGESWSEHKYVIGLLRFPELLRFYQRLGLDPQHSRPYERAVFSQCDALLCDVLQGKAAATAPTVGQFLRANGRSREAWKAVWRAMQRTRRPAWLHALLSPARLAYKTARAVGRLVRPVKA